uniref:hypothetical protein n=1 Tax=Escherichia coli TaxID=562 RepID=UPI00215B1AAC
MFVLILDDAPLNNMLMVEALRDLPGCTARDFLRPAEALAFVRENPAGIGVAISDFEMPFMSGIS